VLSCPVRAISSIDEIIPVILAATLKKQEASYRLMSPGEWEPGRTIHEHEATYRPMPPGGWKAGRNIQKHETSYRTISPGGREPGRNIHKLQASYRPMSRVGWETIRTSATQLSPYGPRCVLVRFCCQL
jgi:hypothetical protein